jgi:hypothetical protein
MCSQAHPWFDPIDFGLLESLQMPAPFVPETSINAAAQESIGAFEETGKKVALTEEDNARFAGWEITNKYALQQELVNLLAFQDSEAAGGAGGTGMERCCAIV